MVILTVLGMLSLLLSAFLVVNTINAVLAQQVSQIGVMKAVGATPGRVMRVYLVMALTYGLMATCIAVMPTPFLASSLIDTMLSMANMDPPPFQVAPGTIMLQLAIGLLAPVVAALWSVFSAARITVRQAISSYGLGLIGRQI